MYLRAPQNFSSTLSKTYLNESWDKTGAEILGRKREKKKRKQNFSLKNNSKEKKDDFEKDE